MFPLVPAPIKFERKEGFFKFLKDDSGAIKYDYVRDDSLPPEGFELRARDSKLVMRSCDEAGRFYGEVTLGVMDALTGGTPSASATATAASALYTLCPPRRGSRAAVSYLPRTMRSKLKSLPQQTFTAR